MSEPIKRYDVGEWLEYGFFVENKESPWVRHKDHAREVEKLREQRDELLEALRFYGSEVHYRYPYIINDIALDGGSKARAVIAKAEGSTPTTEVEVEK